MKSMKQKKSISLKIVELETKTRTISNRRNRMPLTLVSSRWGGGVIKLGTRKIPILTLHSLMRKSIEPCQGSETYPLGYEPQQEHVQKPLYGRWDSVSITD